MADVLITGLLRKRELLQEALSEFKANKLINKVVFSTWRGEVSSEDVDFLKKYDVEILELEPLEDNGVGNIIAQMHAFEHGLNLCDNGYVLKTRSDVLIKDELLKTILQDKTEKVGDNTFDRKVWVPWFDISTPFYMSDECLFGTKRDLAKLYNYDKTFDRIWFAQKQVGLGGATHQRRFYYPFKDEYDVQEWIESNTLIKCFSPKSVKEEFSNNLFVKMLAIYYKILYKYFWVYNPDLEIFGPQPYTSEHTSNFDYEVFIDNFSVENVLERDIILCNNDIFIKRLVEGYYFDEYSKIVLQKINEIS